jgi:hypothetical protein
MPCKECHSEYQREYTSEINVHFQAKDEADKGAVLLFPKLVVCLNCGFTEFTLSENELPLLTRSAKA